MQIATNFYQQLYASQDTTNQEKPAEERVSQNNDEVPVFNTNEIERSLKLLKTEKSPASDGITNEMLIAGTNALTSPLTNLFNLILSTKEIPKQWTCSDIVLLFKKGDPKSISNYRPISLMSCVYKVFASTLLRRLTSILDEHQPVEQAGFVKGFSTTDHIHTLKLVIEKYNEYDLPLYICFIDYSKAFDSISHSAIWRALSKQGVNYGYINILKEIYNKSRARIKINEYGSAFEIGRGVKQGDPLSPKLFIAVLEEIFRTLDWEDRGINIYGNRLSHLRFADDIVLLSEDPKELEFMIQSLSKESRKVGLEINWEKTKLMTNKETIVIKSDSTEIEYVEDYIYLGHLISFKSCNDKEVERRIKITWNKYWAMKEVFKSNLPVTLKTKSMQTCLVPCLTYASQTWPLSSKQSHKVKVCQNSIERSLLGLKLRDKVRNEDIRTITKVKDVTKTIMTQKWKWAGHVQRSPGNKWSRIVTNWYPIHKKRRKGRPFKRWSDDIVATVGNTWSRLARDRAKWKEMEEAFTARAVLTTKRVNAV